MRLEDLVSVHDAISVRHLGEPVRRRRDPILAQRLRDLLAAPPGDGRLRLASLPERIERVEPQRLSCRGGVRDWRVGQRVVSGGLEPLESPLVTLRRLLLPRTP